MAETVGSYGVDSFFSDLVHCDKRISKGFALVLFPLLALVDGAGSSNSKLLILRKPHHQRILTIELSAFIT